MANIEVRKMYGFTITYDPVCHLFELVDMDREVVSRANTQATLEEEAKKLSKSKWKRWPVIHHREHVDITTFNPTSGKGILVYESGKRDTFTLDFWTFYPRTPENEAVLVKLHELGEKIAALHTEERALEKALKGELGKKDFAAHFHGKDAKGVK